MKWNQLNSEQALEAIKEHSADKAIIIFKHSTRCPVSQMALSWFERSWKEEEMKGVEPYFLDLISYRPVSGKVAEIFNVQHESPQLLLIRNGKCTYHRSHSNISYKELQKELG
ncbi:bacillithiol system redox-active protein YtxJ [Nafulsella turpanensis]|uniref:bacillithiol system redox-active protein YtxJ n=1 Tax=Nafulsella turpanensis TaxID=1265690 RepID=UPI0004772269|nr:bacillithiol system redox-active protein YtxJ [Nafulsella turpanensis]